MSEDRRSLAARWGAWALKIRRFRNQSSRTAARGRRRATRAGSDTAGVVGQITQLVATNESLKRENAELLAANERLRAHLHEIGSALGSLSNGSRRRGRGAAQPFALTEAKPKRTRKPITDPAQIERRRAALAKARAVRAEKIAAAREGAAGSE